MKSYQHFWDPVYLYDKWKIKKIANSLSNLHNSNLLECCTDADGIFAVIFGAELINIVDPDFWMTSDLYCIYVFIKPFVMFLYDSFYLYNS